MEEEKETVKKRKKSKLFKATSIISIVAVFIVIFTLGMNVKTSEIISEEKNANLIRIKAIRPTDLQAQVLANDSDFIIVAEGENLNTEVIRNSVYVEPALDYTIEKTLNKNEYRLKFAKNIPENTIVKLQYIKDKIMQDSWAFQTSNKLTIESVYPSDGSTWVSKNTVIDIKFSYPNVENLKENVKIEPKVDGKWKHIGRIWRFTPTKSFEENTRYTVNIGKEIQAQDLQLENGMEFSFSVGQNLKENIYYENNSVDSIITIKPNEEIKIQYSEYGKSDVKIGDAEIYKFANINEFVDYLENYNLNKASKIGKYSTSKNKEYIEIKNSLQNGYYVARIMNTNGKKLFDCPIQICEYSAYAMETERDILVWVGKGNELVSGAKVEYLGKNQVTDNNGMTVFKNAIDKSKKIKYLKVANELVIGIYNFSEKYPNAYLCTDRKLYKGNDTVQIWGFVPLTKFFGNVEDEFYIELNSEGKRKIHLSDEGDFEDKIKLVNHKDEESSIRLYYKDTPIGYDYFSIKNYELQNYTYEFIDKNGKALNDMPYVKDGEDFEFGIKVSHITGLVLQNKKVTISYNYEDNKQIETQETGEDGIAHFKVKTEKSKEIENTDPGYKEIRVYNGDDIEYTEAENSISLGILKRDTYTLHNDNDDIYIATIYKLKDDLSNIQTPVSWDLKQLYDGKYETEVQIKLKEEKINRYITGYEYNPYTKENEPTYYSDYLNKTENITLIKTVQSVDGVAQISKDEIITKKNTDTESYNYQILFEYKDRNGRLIRETFYYFGDDNNNRGIIGYSYLEDYHMGTSADRIYEMPKSLNNYGVFQYLLKNDKEKYDVGDIINLKLAESTKNGIEEIQNEGRLLMIAFKEEIADTNIITENSYNYRFSEKEFPGFKITSAYFINGKFYRMPVQYFEIDKEKRKIDIELTTTKEIYEPGEIVTLNVRTTNEGKPIAAKVNLSVVNEAIFELIYEEDSIEYTIFTPKELAAYTYSSSESDNFIKALNGGGEGGGGGEDARQYFADTAYFGTVTTDSLGKATITFKLPENVTTYRVTAQGATKDLYIGTQKSSITSTLDFFMQSVEPRGIKTTDDVVLNATSSANSKYDVNYEFTIKELNKTLNASGKTNTIVTANFGKLPYGTYTAIIKANNGLMQDAIEYKFDVNESMQEVSKKTTTSIQNNSIITPTKNPIVLEIYSNKLEQYIRYIEFLEKTISERIDTKIAYNEAQRIKEKYYGNMYYKNIIDFSSYHGTWSSDPNNDCDLLRYLKNGEGDLLLTALANYYSEDYEAYADKILSSQNVFEYYVLQASKKENVLRDLLYLKEEKEISNYNKLMVTLGLEFLEDYHDARELYNTIALTPEEQEEYKSIVAIIETFIAKERAKIKIDQMIQENPADEKLRFAIISYLNRSSEEIGNTQSVNIIYGSKKETISINGMQVKTITLNNEDMKNISFATNSNDLMVSYYYKTSIENIEDEDIKQDIKIKANGDFKVGNDINIKIDFKDNYEGEIQIALPNSLRLQRDLDKNNANTGENYYLQHNNIDYIVLHKSEKCKSITLPFTVINEGEYKFENIVCYVDGIYHISNSLNLNIEK